MPASSIGTGNWRTDKKCWRLPFRIPRPEPRTGCGRGQWRRALQVYGSLKWRRPSRSRGIRRRNPSDRDVRLLLEALCYAAADPPPACLLKAASRFARIFELIAPDAPGLVSFAAEFDPSLADSLHAGHPMVGRSPGAIRHRDSWPQFDPPAFCRSGGARHSVGPPVYAFGDHYAALGRYDCANRRGTTYTDGVALI